MIFKKKTMSRDEWIGIEDKSCTDMRVENEWFRGRAGLLRMDRVENPFSVNVFDKNVTITDKDYTWLQLAPKNENFWATVMFDENGRLFEYYFDITLVNHVLEDGKSWFYDMILDVLMEPGGRIMKLDNNELEDALKNGEIGNDEYRFALEAQKRLIEKLTGREKEFSKMCHELRNTLIRKMNG